MIKAVIYMIGGLVCLTVSQTTPYPEKAPIIGAVSILLFIMSFAELADDAVKK